MVVLGVDRGRLSSGLGEHPAALQSKVDAPVPAGFHIDSTPTSDFGDPVAAYLGAAGLKDDGLKAAAGFEPTAAPDLTAIPHEGSRVTLRAPATTPAAGLPDIFTFPDVPGTTDFQRPPPLNHTTMLALGPGGFGRIMTGRPAGGIASWTDAGETSISYVRPNVNVEMMLALEMPAAGQPSDFEGPGLTLHALLDVDHRSRVDSAEIGQATNQFGGRPSATPVDEPQTAVAVGLDLGVLPTFLAQMGVSVSVVVSRGQETGDARVALVGVTELPVDSAPKDRVEQHPASVVSAPLGVGPGSTAFPQGGGSGSGGAPALRRRQRSQPRRRSPRRRSRPR